MPNSLVFAFVVLAAVPLLAADTSPTWRTLVYKRVGDLEIKADVLDVRRSAPRPVVVWLHGGALINGHRQSVPKWLLESCRTNDHVLVSIDYRLAPETQLPEVIRDVEDALAWVAHQGPELFQADAKHIGVVGGSAGGYLTLTMGFRAKPRPQALVSLWGYGDLVGAWYSQPSPHPVHHRIKMSAEEARRQVAGKPISDARDRQGDGGAFYQHCRQTGGWPRAVSGWDPHQEPAKFYPFMALKNVTKEFPPTLLIHGDQDTDVPYEQSELMAAEFQRHQVPHELVRVAGAEHGLAGADPKKVAEVYARATEFLRKQLDQ
jgi:acetyl esterase/lipase